MSIVTKVAKMRLNYHATMLDICNVANQLGIPITRVVTQEGR